jgi:hypothetical protein
MEIIMFSNNIMNKENTTKYYSSDDLRNTLRLLWSNLATWTRFYLVSKFANLDDTIYISNKLYELAIQLANVYRIYYGNEIADKFYSLLKDFIDYSILYIDNLTSTNVPFLNDIKYKWQASASTLSYFLGTINPNFDIKVLDNTLYNYIDLTIHQSNLRYEKDYVSDMVQYDLIEYLTLSLADISWNGLLHQFYNS